MPLAKKASKRLDKVFSHCLGVKKHEKILIVGDTGLKGQYVAPTLAYAYYLATKRKNINSDMIFQKATTRGQNAGKELQKTLKALPKKNSFY